MTDEDLTARVTQLEAWVEVAMKTLAKWGGQDILATELDEARGVHYELDPESREYVLCKPIQILDRMSKLEAWVEVVMRRLLKLNPETLFIELNKARGANYDDE
jgi:hypothetical protein